MSSTVIQVENLSKLYRLGQVGTGTLQHDINRWWHRLRGKEDPYAKVGRANDRTRKKEAGAADDYVWALKDVSFSVRQGEVMGIIGRNGAGKSTLLKILSRVTQPTAGSVKVQGRIASLLEVGTGFHPELSGRDNIYLNGAILGMRRHEIKRKLDEIVEFSGCRAYLDTPVKRYSSGMTVRLAFAVASHLDAEILIIDEVLAVGDGEFQKKCLGKMDDVAKQGRTLLFVSHNMGMITSLCGRAIVLEHGGVSNDAVAGDAVLGYYNSGRNVTRWEGGTQQAPWVKGEGANLIAGSVEDTAGNTTQEVDIREPFRIKMCYQVERDSKMVFPNFHIMDGAGSYVFVTAPVGGGVGSGTGIYEAVCEVPGHLLNNGVYFVGLALTFMDSGVEVAFWEKDALSFQVVDPIEETLVEHRNGYVGSIPGPVRPRLPWTVTLLS